ncbi:MAG: hypothetical protein ABI947_09605 [Chloroflexota bacterium]
MAQFIASTPQAEVIGRSILPAIKAMGTKVRPILATHKLHDIQPDLWYSQQAYLNVYKDIANSKHNATFKLVKIGMQSSDILPLPAHVNSIPAALASLDFAYKRQCRNIGTDGWKVTIIADRMIKCVSSTPFPEDFEYGVLYAIVRRFRPEGASFTVLVDETAPSRKHGADTSTYIVSWSNML